MRAELDLRRIDIGNQAAERAVNVGQWLVDSIL
jgi:hypothetical protein